jgi:hypothetical protein
VYACTPLDSGTGTALPPLAPGPDCHAMLRVPAPVIGILSRDHLYMIVIQCLKKRPLTDLRGVEWGRTTGKICVVVGLAVLQGRCGVGCRKWRIRYNRTEERPRSLEYEQRTCQQWPSVVSRGGRLLPTSCSRRLVSASRRLELCRAGASSCTCSDRLNLTNARRLNCWHELLHLFSHCSSSLHSKMASIWFIKSASKALSSVV